jgi:cleavage and polyadenylation specificity factor subunit 2
MFTFTPLLGAQSNSRASQSILELDGGVKVLVDVGWDERFDTRQLAEIEKRTSTISFILLTHATISHLGAYAHCCKHVPHFSQIPVYATSPVIAFGRTLLQDLYASTPQAATFIPASASPEDGTSVTDQQRSDILRQAPNVEEINKYFTAIMPLKYSQPHQPVPSQFSVPLDGLTLTAYNSGHTLGGTIWHIQHGMESIVYAVDWNQARENVIAGAAWFGGVGGSEVIDSLRKPTALVCSSIGGNKVAPYSRKTRDDTLLGHIRSCISRGGSVLIPTDSSARILELAWILEKAWHEGAKEAPFKGAKVYMASKSANATLRHARSLLEWMDDSIVREFEGEEEAATKTHRHSGSKQANGISKPSRPFEFRHVKVVERKAQLERCLAGEGPRVVLASDLTLDWGYSKSFLESFTQQTPNLVLLTERVAQDPNTKSTGQSLWRIFEERADGVAVDTIADVQLEQVHGGGRTMPLQTVERAPLDDKESQQYQQYMATQRQMEETLAGDATGDVVADDIDDESSSSSEDESDNEQQGRALNVINALGHNRAKLTVSDEDLGVNVLLRKKNVFDFDVRNKKGRNAVFPYTHSRKRGDEFGDFIKPEDFLREEEKEEQEAANQRTGDIGQKRKWDDKQKDDQPRKRRQGNQGQKVDTSGDASSSDSDDSDTEEVEVQDFQGPAKAVFASRKITLNCRLAFVDFAGLHDQRSLQMLIPLIGPKKLILTGGSVEETLALAADCQELLGVKVAGEDETSAEIFTPSPNQIIDASVDTNAWAVKLTRNLVKRLQWQNVKDVGVVTLQGQLRAEMETLNLEEDPITKKQKIDTDVAREKTPPPTSNALPVLDILPPALAAATRSVTQPIHVGDMRLAELRRLMNMAGHNAEFRGEGTLLVDGMIAVRKLGSGKIIVEGTPVNSLIRNSDSFTQVKRQIYERLAVVAAV